MYITNFWFFLQIQGEFFLSPRNNSTTKMNIYSFFILKKIQANVKSLNPEIEYILLILYSDDVFLPRPPPLHHAAYTHSNNSIALNPNSSLHLRRHSHNHASLKLVITLLDSLALISSSSSAVNVGGRRRRCGSYVVFLEWSVLGLGIWNLNRMLLI